MICESRSRVISIIIVIIVIDTVIFKQSPPSSSLVGATSTPVHSFHNLQLISNVRMTTDDVTKTSSQQSTGLIDCVVLCLYNPRCLSLSFQPESKLCHSHQLTMSSTGVRVFYDTAYKYTEIQTRVEWNLAFRAKARIGVSVYDTWMNTGHHDDVTSVTSNTIGCLTVDDSLPCDRHLRTWRLDDWTNVALVKHAFYTDSQEVFYVTFDASGITSSNRDDHFRVSRIVSSSATQLVGYNETLVFESITGEDSLHRRFFLHHLYEGCDNDFGWMFINDASTGVCPYEISDSYPNFLYTPKTYSYNWASDDTPKANVFAVFIKYND